MKRFLLSVLFVLLATTGWGAMKDMVINEILVRNYDNYEDEYGHRTSWIELFNSGYSSVNIANCYLVIESGGQSASYRIPKNDTRTLIPPQGYTVFFCEGSAFKGTFYTNFTLSMDGKSGADAVMDSTSLRTTLPNKEIKLSFLDANGRDTISSVRYNLADQKPDISMGFLPDAEGMEHFIGLVSVTPYAINDTHEPIPPYEVFRQTDPVGYGMAAIAMTVVLVALTLLYLVFRTIGKTMTRMAEKRTQKEAGEAAPVEKTAKRDEVFSGDDMAAIALALHLYNNDLHDQESAVLTINRVAKAYSPWSSKLYGLTQLPDRAPWRK